MQESESKGAFLFLLFLFDFQLNQIILSLSLVFMTHKMKMCFSKLDTRPLAGADADFMRHGAATV